MDVKKATAYLRKADHQLAVLVDALGQINVPAPRNDFESLVDAIVSQQLSVKAAATIHHRLINALGRDVRPEVVLSTGSEILREVGLSGQKTTYLYALAEAFARRPEVYSNLNALSDQEVIHTLTEIKGIGVWTAQMFLMFNLLREDVFPVGDLGVRRAMERLFYQGEKQGDKLLIQRAEIWRPYRSVASLYLWKSVD